MTSSVARGIAETDMGNHARSDTGLRRARAATWTVLLSMDGTTMTFHVYHSVIYGRMAWPARPVGPADQASLDTAACVNGLLTHAA